MTTRLNCDTESELGSFASILVKGLNFRITKALEDLSVLLSKNE